MSSKVVKGTLFVTVISFCVFAIGFIMSVQDVLHPKASNVTNSKETQEAKGKQPSDTLNIVGLGDSLTRGVGDKEGIGYIGRLKDSLQNDYQQKVALTNLAVSGAKTKDLLQQIEGKGAAYSIQQADIIVLTIGGNDLFPGFESMSTIDVTTYQPDTEAFQNDARQILSKLRELNPDSPIFWMGLYNPFEDVEDLKGSSSLVVDWNASLEKLVLDYENVYVIPTFDLFQSNGEDLLYSDHFHPNEIGYEFMAERLVQNVVSKLGIDGGDEK